MLVTFFNFYKRNNFASLLEVLPGKLRVLNTPVRSIRPIPVFSSCIIVVELGDGMIFLSFADFESFYELD